MFSCLALPNCLWQIQLTCLGPKLSEVTPGEARCSLEVHIAIPTMTSLRYLGSERFTDEGQNHGK